MGILRSYSCVLCLLFWGNLMLGESSVHAAEPSGDEERKPPVFKENSYFPSVSLSASFSEELEVSDHCMVLLHDFGQRYASLASCLVSNARPVKVCQNCYREYNSFQEIYTNISNTTGPGNVSCQNILLSSDRLMLLSNLYSGIDHIWHSSDCQDCLTKDQKSVSNTTLDFINRHNQSLTCFEKYQQGNQSELCVECRTLYKTLNDLYSNMSNNKSLCIDVEDAMNMTRHLWSKNNCSLKREDSVPVIAVSSFMLFLPIIFYLSNFLHSEQKKRKLMHPKRAKSSHSLMNIQDKYS
ncbi:hypothetical protein PHYPO_G00187280 [Pangasianodon hypophthalmus]|uniref:Osteopetrosis-associated transmembrane protein 1 n=1 Tax=Pangasianodon hypophthalmus TaxID=310915 RepID=A0A5N5JEY2_PANHP|nr:hypothetical protein PHYPO_G00187280 [Pangasianodon hypophthalmus]